MGASDGCRAVSSSAFPEEVYMMPPGLSSTSLSSEGEVIAVASLAVRFPGGLGSAFSEGKNANTMMGLLRAVAVFAQDAVTEAPFLRWD